MSGRHIVLTGMMGSGKTAVGERLARRLGLPFYDADALLEAEAGKRIADLFAGEGEAHFRALERRLIGRLLAERPGVIATGGGAFVDAENRARLKIGGTVVCLLADVETLLARVSGSTQRPLLQGPDSVGRLRALLKARLPAYAEAHHLLDTSDRTPDEIAALLCRVLQSREPSARRTVRIALGDRSYDVLIGSGLLEEAGERIRALGLTGRVAIVTDDTVGPLYGARLEGSLRMAGFEPTCIEVPTGEASKSLGEAARLYEAFLDAGLDRHGAVLALGGGVVGDLAGFVAATFMRGIAHVQVPTTLLAQVDSSVGGKVGVNLPRGKNLVGAFYQPRLVLADVACLRSLPIRQLRAGLAEVVKYGVIADGALFTWLEGQVEPLLAAEERVLADAVAASCRIKASVVEVDEREAGPRAILNFGHTVGHAIEAASGYGRYLHGEAVALGMLAATDLSVRLGLCVPALRERLARLLECLGLPTRASLKVEDIEKSMYYDKKVKDGMNYFVLTKDIGSVTVARIFDREALRETLATIVSPPTG
ncbi:MAG: 3-dehydroquinate synthase [Candidatus Methylomirabilales bacterium]